MVCFGESMKRTLAVIALLFIGVLGFGDDQLRSFLKEQVRYWGIEEKVSDADLNKLVELKQKTDQPELSKVERTKAYDELFHFVQKLRGLPQTSVPSAMAVSFWNRQPVSNPVPAKHRELGAIKNKGTGGIPMILIPDLAADWTVFDSYMEWNRSHFTFFAVTLPGFGGTAP